jgi:hypothetical protein
MCQHVVHLSTDCIGESRVTSQLAIGNAHVHRTGLIFLNFFSQVCFVRLRTLFVLRWWACSVIILFCLVS